MGFSPPFIRWYDTRIRSGWQEGIFNLLRFFPFAQKLKKGGLDCEAIEINGRLPLQIYFPACPAGGQNRFRSGSGLRIFKGIRPVGISCSYGTTLQGSNADGLSLE